MYPAGEPGVTARHVALDDGLSVRVVESGPPKGDAVLLVHGWAASVYSYAEMIPALAAAGHRAIAFDLPGHGLSDKPTDEDRYTTRALANVILSVATAVGVSRFTLVGHSMGGSLAIELATRGEIGGAGGGGRVTKLVLINSVGLGSAPILLPVKLASPGFVNRIVPALLTRRVVGLVVRLAFGTRGRPTERDIDEYWAPTQFDELAWACRACIHRVTWSRTPATKLRSLRLPVLVITGGRDLLVRGVASRARLIPTVRVVAIREGGHLVMQECASRTNEELLLFLKGGRSRR
jgi:pimeloyl-ACP methyl ester carboxylesterase